MSGAPSAEERGDTVPRWVRWLVRLLAVAAFVAGTLVVAHIRNGDGTSDPSTADPTAAATGAAQAEPPADPLEDAGRQVRLLDDDDARLRTVSLAAVVGTRDVAGTLVLGARPSPYTLADLVRLGAATRVSTSVVLLTEPVMVRRDASLVVEAPGTTLRLRSDPDGFTSLVSWGGSISLVGGPGKPLTVVGWDPAGHPDRTTGDGRAYVRVKDGGLRVAHAELSHLGFWSGRTGGLALTGSDETIATGDLEDVAIDLLHLGLYVSGAQRVRAEKISVLHTEQFGIEVTNRSRDVRVGDVVVRDAGQDGISVSNGSSHVDVTGATVSGSSGYGIDVDGSPLADGPNSAGYGIGNYAWVRLDHTRVVDNSGGGIRVTSVDQLAIDHSRVTAERSALTIRGASRDVAVTTSRLVSAVGSGLVLADGVQDASLSASTVEGLEIGVDVQDSVVTIADNTITVGTGHGILVAGSDAEATLSGNTINGRGSGAVHSSDGASVTGGDTSDGDWTYRPGIVLWAERHSAAMPLLLVLVVPIVGLLFVLRRRRQQRELRQIFESTLVAQGRSAIASYAAPGAAAAAGPLPGAAAGPPVFGPEPEPAPETSLPTPAPVPVAPVPLAEREFTTPREFALAAVLEAGYPPNVVARVLHVPTSRVRAWVDGAEEPVEEPPAEETAEEAAAAAPADQVTVESAEESAEVAEPGSDPASAQR